jgi:hypothetical protein
LKDNTAGAFACASAFRVKALAALFVICLPASNRAPSGETMKLHDVANVEPSGLACALLRTATRSNCPGAGLISADA